MPKGEENRDIKTKTVSKPKKKKRKKGKASLITLAMLCVCAYAIYQIVTQQFLLNALKVQKAQKIAEVQAITIKNEQMQKIIDNINTPEYMEKRAREQLGLVKPGEKIFIDSNNVDKNK